MLWTNLMLSTACVNILAICAGIAIAWPSCAIPYLESVDTHLDDGELSRSETIFINLLYSFGGFVGSLSSEFVCDKLGRVWVLRIIAALHLTNYLLITYNYTTKVISISRIVIGIAVGASYITIPTFISEIHEKDNQNSFRSFTILCQAIGMLFSYICGSFLNITYLSWIYIWNPMFFLLFSQNLVETPFHLIRRGKIQESEESLMFYRGVKSMKDKKVREEFENLVQYVNLLKEEKIVFEDFLLRAAYKHLFIGLLLVAFEEFSGCYFLLYRIGSLFEYFSGVSPDVASVLIGSIQFLGAFASIFMIERIKRRIMIIGSVIGVSSGFILAGSFTHLPHVLIIGLSTSLFSSNIGIFVLSQIIITEIAPVKIKNKILTICTCFSWIIIFLLFNLETPIIEGFGAAGLLYYFAINSIVCGVLIVIFLPETKGKSLDEISEMMQN